MGEGKYSTSYLMIMVVRISRDVWFYLLMQFHLCAFSFCVFFLSIGMYIPPDCFSCSDASLLNLKGEERSFMRFGAFPSYLLLLLI